MKYSTYIFDLDGTLSNPLAGMADSINHALAKHDYAERSLDEIATYIGPPLEGTLANIIGSNDTGQISAVVHSYRDHYRVAGYSNNYLYDGIIDMLNQLRQAGAPVGVCTSKPKAAAIMILEHFDILNYFEFVSGGDVGIKKGQQLEQLLAEGQIDNKAIMIGDRNVDIIAAQQSELTSLGVLWGFGSAEELSQAKADHLISRPAEVLGLV
ncbi:MAG: HAD-IA family hydrolase [Granulosicoccaceae bacterium]